MKKILSLAVLLSTINAMALELSCHGTEPFWGLQITDKTMTYRSAEFDQDLVFEVVSKYSASGVAKDYAFVVDTKYTSLTVITSSCNDGMSDTTYPYSTILRRNNVVLLGCCEVTKN